MSPKLSVLVTRFCNPCSRRAILVFHAERLPSHPVIHLLFFSLNVPSSFPGAAFFVLCALTKSTLLLC